MTSNESPLHGANPAEIDRTLRDFLEQFAKEKAEYEATQIRCGIVGRSGVGKSSLINAIVDQKLAPVGSSKETTLEANEYVHRGLVFGANLVDEYHNMAEDILTQLGLPQPSK